MRRFIFIILIVFPLVAKSQSSMGIWGNVVNSEAGSRIELVASKASGGGYNLSITHRYQDVSREHFFLTVCIPAKQVEIFKSQLRQVKAKYDEWEKTARSNNVIEVKKEIPVALTAYDNMYGSKLSYPETKNMKAVFFVFNHAIHCNIEASISGYNVYQLYTWVLTSADIGKIITEIDRTIQHQRNYDAQQRQIDGLFN